MFIIFQLRSASDRNLLTKLSYWNFYMWDYNACLECSHLCNKILGSLLPYCITYVLHLTLGPFITVSAMASVIIGVSIVYSIVCSGVDQRKHQKSASLAFVSEIHRSPMNFPHNGGQQSGKCFHLMMSSCNFSIYIFSYFWVMSDSLYTPGLNIPVVTGWFSMGHLCIRSVINDPVYSDALLKRARESMCLMVNRYQS